MRRSDSPICRICSKRGKEVPATYYSDVFPDARWYICDRHAEILYTWAFGPIESLKGEQQPMPTFDASQVPGALQDMKEAKSLNDLMGEPLEITFIRALNIPPKNGQPQRTSYVGEYVSLATGESGEVWLPDRQGGALLKFSQEHEDARFQGRWFKDPQVNGEIKRGWQFLGVDQVPEDKGNKSVFLISGKVGEQTAASTGPTMPF